MRSRLRTVPRILVLISLAIGAVAGCGERPAAGCEAWRPILVADGDVFADETARALLAHNLTGRRLCGW